MNEITFGPGEEVHLLTADGDEWVGGVLLVVGMRIFDVTHRRHYTMPSAIGTVTDVAWFSVERNGIDPLNPKTPPLATMIVAERLWEAYRTHKWR